LTTTLAGAAAGLGAYLAGAIPFGYLVARSRGVDIRRVGSGNIGATNVTRCVGRPWGILTFVCDLLKGLLPALCLPPLLLRVSAGTDAQTLRVICGVAAILGHNWSIFLGFRGGKGVATSAGALLALAPLAMGIGALVWGTVYRASRYVSLASIAAALAVAASSWWPPATRGHGALLTPAVLTVLAMVVIGRHHANIRRLLNGTENRGRRHGEEAGHG